MICQRCKERPATIRYREQVGATVKEIHLCEKCAAEISGGAFVPSGFISSIFSGEESRPRARAQKECPFCGTRYADFARTGLVGCAECYQTFRAELEPVLRKMHGKTRHEGKVPKKAGGDYALMREYNELTAKKEQAVVEERFEEAAEINKRLKELSETLKKKGLR